MNDRIYYLLSLLTAVGGAIILEVIPLLLGIVLIVGFIILFSWKFIAKRIDPLLFRYKTLLEERIRLREEEKASKMKIAALQTETTTQIVFEPEVPKTIETLPPPPFSEEAEPTETKPKPFAKAKSKKAKTTATTKTKRRLDTKTLDRIFSNEQKWGAADPLIEIRTHPVRRTLERTGLPRAARRMSQRLQRDEGGHVSFAPMLSISAQAIASRIRTKTTVEEIEHMARPHKSDQIWSKSNRTER